MSANSGQLITGMKYESPGEQFVLHLMHTRRHAQHRQCSQGCTALPAPGLPVRPISTIFGRVASIILSSLPELASACQTNSMRMVTAAGICSVVTGVTTLRTVSAGGWRRWGPPDERSQSEHYGGDRRQDPPRSGEVKSDEDALDRSPAP
jgi:hypothetical protein